MVWLFSSYYFNTFLRLRSVRDAVVGTGGYTASPCLIAWLAMPAATIILQRSLHATVGFAPFVHCALADVPRAIVIVPDGVVTAERVDGELDRSLLQMIDQSVVVVTRQTDELRRKHERLELDERLLHTAGDILRQKNLARSNANNVVVSSALFATMSLRGTFELSEYTVTSQVDHAFELCVREEFVNQVALERSVVSL